MRPSAARHAGAFPGERLRSSLLLAVLALTLSACVTLPRQGFTAADQAAATPVGFAHVRWTEDDPTFVQDLQAQLRPTADGTLNILAVSGGGANGAYGAGLITAWTRTGGRPEFQLVTGVSAGALVAPFVFLGPAWDDTLAATYRAGGFKHFLQKRGPLGLLTPGLYSKRPLEILVERYVTDGLLAAIAGEQAKGRRLLVATTDLDTEHLVVWDMGAIAAHGGPEARKLFADVLVASASVPLVFPPSLIAVQAGAHRFGELHVDGQTESAFLGVPQPLLLARVVAASSVRTTLYVLVNGSLESPFAVTPRATLPILSRTFDAANKASLRSLLIANAEFCRAGGCTLFVASLPPAVRDDSLDFSAEHLTALFEAGAADIDMGHAWRTAPPSRPQP